MAQAVTHSPVLPSAEWNCVGALISGPFHGSIAPPACAPINASRVALRLHAHDTGPGWLARPYLYGSFIRDFTPAYPGAPKLGPKTRANWPCFRAFSSGTAIERAMGIERRPKLGRRFALGIRTSDFSASPKIVLTGRVRGLKDKRNDGL
jgi:hypothetical protein